MIIWFVIGGITAVWIAMFSYTKCFDDQCEKIAELKRRDKPKTKNTELKILQ
jgi:hypothetical protein